MEVIESIEKGKLSKNQASKYYGVHRKLSAKLNEQGIKCGRDKFYDFLREENLLVKYRKLIHHSDRGFQYCNPKYTQLLKNNHVEISMTTKYDPYENVVAERVNGILKTEYELENFDLKNWSKIFSSEGDPSEENKIVSLNKISAKVKTHETYNYNRNNCFFQYSAIKSAI